MLSFSVSDHSNYPVPTHRKRPTPISSYNYNTSLFYLKKISVVEPLALKREKSIDVGNI